MDDIYTVGEVPPALVPLADLERERLWRANAQADLHELEQKYNALAQTARRLLELAEFGQRGQLVSGGITAMLIEELRAHTPDPPR